MKTTWVKQSEQDVLPRTSIEEFDPIVEGLVRRRISENRTYAFYFSDVAAHCCRGVLTLQGRVPTFHLKQILQTMLRGLEGVEQIENQVNVVSSNGLSSTPTKQMSPANPSRKVNGSPQ